MPPPSDKQKQKAEQKHAHKAAHKVYLQELSAARKGDADACYRLHLLLFAHDPV
eukprot:CAMPEP_0197605846 /NCGR_PEP_ID=MMETSP1326-20131121/43916_1 /TAXON_ID=1155430 /ORGANISM="Genus nov. species nov., Strain RCC2288" /LENGTH=53 /DNA_ID=CAMNT_0043173695 /DNA_START=15 /DNA_END=173 /DNA_ORIENTATION=-